MCTAIAIARGCGCCALELRLLSVDIVDLESPLGQLTCRHTGRKCGSVVVANHTTPIDIVMLAVDNCFTLVGPSAMYGFLKWL